MKKIKLLLADDHQIMLDGLKAFLEKEEALEVVAAVLSGEKALETMEKSPVDVAVLDISMPGGMDGFETATVIKKKYVNTKIILLTMFNEGQYVLNALELGVDGYVVKEKSKETLVGAIHSVVKNTPYYSPELLAKIKDAKPFLKKEEIQLTRREKEIVYIMAENPEYTSKDIGQSLSIDSTTVDKHIQNIIGKLGLRNRAALKSYASKNQIT